MAKRDHYFQFPIHVLYHGKPLDKVSQVEKEVALRRIMYVTFRAVGGKLMETTKDAHDVAEREAERSDYERWFNVDDDEHVEVVLGAMAFGVTVPPPGYWPKGTLPPPDYWPKGALPPKDFGSRLVRLRTDLLWDYLKNPVAPFRDLAVLCAIYAGIGKKAYARLSYEQIRCMALGFNGIKEYEEKTEEGREDNRLTIRQTQYTVRSLYDRGLFVRVCPNKRHIYYSHKMSAPDLTQAVVKRVATNKAKRASVAVMDRVANDTVRSEVEAMTAQFLADLKAKFPGKTKPR